LSNPWIRRSRSSKKVIDFGANRKRVYDFLLVRLGPILHRFGDIAGFCAPEQGWKNLGFSEKVFRFLGFLTFFKGFFRFSRFF